MRCRSALPKDVRRNCVAAVTTQMFFDNSSSFFERSLGVSFVKVWRWVHKEEGNQFCNR